MVIRPLSLNTVEMYRTSGGSVDVVCLTNSSGMGFNGYRADITAGDRPLLRLPLQDLLEEAQGQGIQEGTQERRGPQERPDTRQYSQGQSTINLLPTYIARVTFSHVHTFGTSVAICGFYETVF